MTETQLGPAGEYASLKILLLEHGPNDWRAACGNPEYLHALLIEAWQAGHLHGTRGTDAVISHMEQENDALRNDATQLLSNVRFERDLAEAAYIEDDTDEPPLSFNNGVFVGLSKAVRILEGSEPLVGERP